MEGGFAAVAGDIADIKRDMATKEQVIALHTQVNSIEAQQLYKLGTAIIKPQPAPHHPRPNNPSSPRSNQRRGR
jgi:hypothetical protein